MYYGIKDWYVYELKKLGIRYYKRHATAKLNFTLFAKFPFTLQVAHSPLDMEPLQA
ncbi:hypothetical protein BG07_1440 [Bacillus pseudomycoides]|nr:DUF2639 domain-containing protein [Bacillus pseudomycoides]AIK36757.1 hypothetical protein DJ92_3504 [Bacillus pseudomycoides]AJI16714.1 hypothetical protein BG07_1440 [Bacillus pseudomycoides]